MSYPQKSYYSPDRIQQNTQMIKSVLFSPNKSSYISSLQSNVTKFNDCFYHSKPIKYLCISKNCECKYYTVCDHNQCKDMHSHPNLNIIQLGQYEQFKMKHLQSINLIKSKVNEYQKQVIEIMIHKIAKDFQLVRSILDTFYVHKAARKIAQGKNEQITSKQLGQFVQNSLLMQENNFNFNKSQGSFLQSKNLILQTIKKLQQSVKNVVQSKQYKVLTLQDVIIQRKNGSGPKSLIKKQTFSSQIIQFKEQYQSLIKMLRQNRITQFQQFKLLYRGSQNEFSASSYHSAVDDHSSLLLIISSESKKFGAYLNCKSVQSNSWISDPTGMSFIFSLDHNQTYRIRPSADCRSKAMFGGIKGPQIGAGCDIYLSDKCHQNYQSGSNFGASFMLPFGLDFGSKKAKSFLAGKQSFQVRQYQVFTLV